MLQNDLAFPFEIEIRGTPAIVEDVDLNDAEDIVAICRRDRHKQLIPILNLPLPSPRPVGWEWIEAYRRWARGDSAPCGATRRRPTITHERVPVLRVSGY